jgi:hypothetical protein
MLNLPNMLWGWDLGYVQAKVREISADLRKMGKCVHDGSSSGTVKGRRNDTLSDEAFKSMFGYVVLNSPWQELFEYDEPVYGLEACEDEVDDSETEVTFFNPFSASTSTGLVSYEPCIEVVGLEILENQGASLASDLEHRVSDLRSHIGGRHTAVYVEMVPDYTSLRMRAAVFPFKDQYVFLGLIDDGDVSFFGGAKISDYKMGCVDELERFVFAHGFSYLAGCTNIKHILDTYREHLL